MKDLKDLIERLHKEHEQYENDVRVELDKTVRMIMAPFFKWQEEVTGTQKYRNHCGSPGIYSYLPDVLNLHPNYHKGFYQHPLYKMYQRAVHTEKQMEEFIPKFQEETIEANRVKLDNAITKKLAGYEIIDVKEVDFNGSPQGWQGAWMLTLKDGRRLNFNTKAIYAGGYNIQCLHYRYLSKVKEV